MLGCVMGFCKKKEKLLLPTVDDLAKIVLNGSNANHSIEQIFPYRDAVPYAHDLILTLIHYSNINGIYRTYFDEFADFISLIEEAETFVNESMNSNYITTPRATKRISNTLIYMYVVTKNKKILDTTYYFSNYNSDMRVANSRLNKIIHG